MDPVDTLSFSGTCTQSVRREQVSPNSVRMTETFVRFKAEVPRPREAFEEREFVCPVCGATMSVKVASAAASRTRFRVRILATVVLAALAALYVTSCVREGLLPGEHLGTMAWEGFLAFASGLGALLAAVTARESIWVVRGAKLEGVDVHTVHAAR